LRDPAPSLARRRNQSAYGVALFALTPEIRVSFEYRRLSTLPGTGRQRHNSHYDWVLAYSF
jgi:hypothetical protein